MGDLLVWHGVDAYQRRTGCVALPLWLSGRLIYLKPQLNIFLAKIMSCCCIRPPCKSAGSNALDEWSYLSAVGSYLRDPTDSISMEELGEVDFP